MKLSRIFLILGALAMVTSAGNADDRELSNSTSNRDSSQIDDETARTPTETETPLALDSSILGDIEPQITKAVVPHELEIKVLPGDFISWGKAKSIHIRDEQTLRLGSANDEKFFSWELADAPYPGNNILQTGIFTLPSGAGPGTWQLTDINPWGLPPIPPDRRQDFYLHMIDSAGRTSNSVVITYGANDDDTRFTEVGLNPHILNPLRVFIDLAEFEIINSDEGADEPYMINILIVMDGTTVDVFDLPNSSVRVLANPTTHGNIPQYNGNLTTGTTVFIPDEMGRLVATVAPINPELADVNLFGNYIFPDFLNHASTQVLVSIVLEEDLVSTMAAQSMSNALVEALQS